MVSELTLLFSSALEAVSSSITSISSLFDHRSPSPSRQPRRRANRTILQRRRLSRQRRTTVFPVLPATFTGRTILWRTSTYFRPHAVAPQPSSQPSSDNEEFFSPENWPWRRTIIDYNRGQPIDDATGYETHFPEIILALWARSSKRWKRP